MEKYVDEEIDLFELNDRLIELLIQNHGKSLPKLMVREEVLDDIFHFQNHFAHAPPVFILSGAA